MNAKKSQTEVWQAKVNHEHELSVDSTAEATRKAELIAALAERGWIAVERANGDFAVGHGESSWRRRVRGLARLEIVARHVCGTSVLREAAGGTER
jgi:hypothetical protein